MRPPCELVQREFLPQLRMSLSKKLSSSGLSQIEIAKKLGITQAAVSKYLSQHSTDISKEYPIEILSTRLAQSFLSNSQSSPEILKDVCGTCMSLRIGAEICMAHKAVIPSLKEQDCSICSELLGGTDPNLTSRSKVLDDIQEGLQIILDSETFSNLVPEVRANLVSCSQNATDISEVAGVPGRITSIEGRARAFVAPRFGTSTHTASLLLKIKNKWSSFRACICLSGSENVLHAAKESGVKIVQLQYSTNDSIEISNAVFGMIRKKPSGYLGINVPGGIGVEPILYIFGKTATSLGKLSVEIGSCLRA